MKIIDLDTFFKNINYYNQKALKNNIFIYPTDTIYWIWGIFPETLEKIYKVKKRPLHKKVSIILPERSRFKQILEINKTELKLIKSFIEKDIWAKKQWFTFIWKMKKSFWENLPNFAQKIYNDRTLGVRILNHPFQNFIKKLNKPFITTSANISWKPNIKNISTIEKELFEAVDYIVDWWILSNPPSILVTLKNNKIEFLNRK